MDKHLGSSHCKILGTVLKKEKGGTYTNRLEDKKANDDTQSLTSER